MWEAYKGLHGTEADSILVDTCHYDGLSANVFGKGFCDFQGFGVVAEVCVCGGRHGKATAR